MDLNRLPPSVTARSLGLVFGTSTEISDPEMAARASERLFARDETHLAPWFEGDAGPTITAFESLKAFGWGTLSRLVDKDAVGFLRTGCEVGALLRSRRVALKLTTSDVARRAGLANDAVTSAEGGKDPIPVEVLTGLGEVLALEEWRIGRIGVGSPAPVTSALRGVATNLGDTLTGEMALDLLEAVWLVATRLRLREWIEGGSGTLSTSHKDTSIPSLAKSRNEGWAEGARLAGRVRREHFSGDEPVWSVTRLAEDLGIGVVHKKLSKQLSGAALRSGEVRSILVNTTGINANPGTLRLTIGHELCHALWDPDESWDDLEVGASLDPAPPGSPADLRECRAQAFSSELLLPAAVAADRFEQGGRRWATIVDLAETFGVSLTAASRQVKVGHATGGDPMGMRPSAKPVQQRWALRELPEDVDGLPDLPPERSGDFMRVCQEAWEKRLISGDTAARLLKVDLATLSLAFDAGRDAPLPGSIL